MKLLTWQLCGFFAFMPLLNYASLLFFCFPPQLLWLLPSACLRLSSCAPLPLDCFSAFLAERASALGTDRRALRSEAEVQSDQ